MSSEEIVFDGGEGLCERFIRLVRKAAFAQGKLDDSKWVAMFASTCFEGKALRWYSALDPATKTDWNLMEPALLTEFSGPVLNAQAEEKAPPVDQESTMPTPAAAPPPRPFAEEQEPPRPSSPISYEPTPAPAPAPEPAPAPAPAAAPPPSILEGRPWPPPREPSYQGKPGPPPPPPPRNNAFAPSYQTGSGFRPPPRHPSAGPSSSSKSSGPSPGLYGSFMPKVNPSTPPPPPPRNSFPNPPQPQEQVEHDVPKPTEPRRETSEYDRRSSTEHLDDGTTYQNWKTNTPQPSWKPNTPSEGAAPPRPTYSGHPEPQSDLPSPPPPPPRREPQFPPPPPRRTPSTNQGPQFPNAGPGPAGVQPQFTGGGAGIPPQFTGGSGFGVPPQYTGGAWPGQQQQYATGNQPPPPTYFAGTNTARRGRIRVGDPAGGTYYVRESLNWFGGYKRTSKIGDAVVVLWDPVNEPGRLRLLSPVNQQPWIGITWATVPKGRLPAVGKGSKDQADLAAIAETPQGTTSSASHRDGPSSAAVWFMNSDMTLEARLPGPNGVQYTLEVAVGSGTKWIWLVSDFETFALSNVGQIKSWLFFEPI